MPKYDSLENRVDTLEVEPVV